RRIALALGTLGVLASAPAFPVPYPVGIARANAEVAARFPAEPENARFLYMLFQPRFAPPLVHWRLLGASRMRDHLAWSRLASVPGHGWIAAAPVLLLVTGLLGLRRARGSAASP
ncbi:MAG: hypothetical protein ACREIU_13140, partial [Planctomycetota bacterium]